MKHIKAIVFLNYAEHYHQLLNKIIGVRINHPLLGEGRIARVEYLGTVTIIHADFNDSRLKIHSEDNSYPNKVSTIEVSDEIYNEIQEWKEKRIESLFNQYRIEKIVQRRGITDVFHFTREMNLSTIMQYGLLSRRDLESRGIPFIFNDNLRLDNAIDSISVSIGFPNYKMFYSYRMSNPNDRWIVVSIMPEILWILRCAFCITNAASNVVRFTDIQSRMTSKSLEAMFGDYQGRERGNIPASYTTSPQAEVLVFDAIPVNMIQSYCVMTENDAHRIREQCENINCVVRPEVFAGRCDWARWSS